VPQCFSVQPEDRPGIDPNGGAGGENGAGGASGGPGAGGGQVPPPGNADLGVTAIPDGGFDNNGDATGDKASGCDACTVRSGAAEPWIFAALAGFGLAVRRRRRR
jgi:MYXO-CTERM domain-containing protein